MAPKRQAKPPKQAALAAAQNLEGSGGVGLSVKVCTLPVLMNRLLCSCQWSNNPSLYRLSAVPMLVPVQQGCAAAGSWAR